MSRNIIEQSNQRPVPEHDGGLKLKLEKGIIVVAVLLICMVLFLLPKYEAYALNQTILQQKNDLQSDFSETMTEAEFLSEASRIQQRLEESKMAIPEQIDTVGLYQGMVEMAEKSEVNLVSVKFAPLNTQIDEALGQKIEPAFSDRDDKTIKGPDDRYLARCVFVVVCSGDEANCVRFLKELVAYQPIIRVIGTEIKGELPAQKTMTLQLESYATVGAETKEKAEQQKN